MMRSRDPRLPEQPLPPLPAVAHSEANPVLAGQDSSPAVSRRPRFNWRHAYILFTLPGIVGITAFLILPLLYGLYLSFRDFSLARMTDNFVGLEQYGKLIADPLFIRALSNTLIYVVAVVSADFVIGLGAAVLLYRLSERWSRLLRAIYLLPMMIMPAVVAVLWRNVMYNPPYAEFSRIFGLETSFLAHPNTALWGIIIAAIWGSWPFVFVLLLAGLESLPVEPMEAAAIDGANWLQTLWHVILPMMRPVLVVTLGIKAVDSFKSFEFAWLLTRGGPAESSHVLMTFAYQQAFGSLDYGYGSAATILLSLLALVFFSGLFVYLWRQRNEDNSV